MYFIFIYIYGSCYSRISVVKITTAPECGSGLLYGNTVVYDTESRLRLNMALHSGAQ